MKQTKTVFVTAIGSFSAGAVIAACKRDGYRVIGCDIYPAEWVVNSMDVDRFYQAPYATDRAAYRAFIKEICSRESIDYLMPLTDVEIDVFQDWRLENREEFAGLGAVVCMSDEAAISLCRNKEACAAVLEEQGACRTIPGYKLAQVLPVIDAYEKRGTSDEAFGKTEKETGWEPLEEWTYPLVLKPLDGRSSQGLQIIETPEQMVYAAKQCRDQADRYLLQPKIAGTVVTADVVRDPKTGDLVCLPRREFLRTLNGAGTSVQVFRDDRLESQCRRIGEILNVKGCVNFEFIEAEKKLMAEAPGQEALPVWYFLECNPRFAGGVAFSCKAGYDMIRNHLNCFTGRPIEPMGQIGDQYIARRYTEYRMKEETNDKEA